MGWTLFVNLCVWLTITFNDYDQTHSPLMRQVLMNIYVGNLPYRLTNEKLEETFGAFGQVGKANIIMDRETGRSKGFGFVEMPSATEAEAAINALNGTELEGRNITVNQARPREENNRPKQRKAW